MYLPYSAWETFNHNLSRAAVLREVTLLTEEVVVKVSGSLHMAICEGRALQCVAGAARSEGCAVVTYHAQCFTLTPLRNCLESCLGAARPGGLCSGFS